MMLVDIITWSIVHERTWSEMVKKWSVGGPIGGQKQWLVDCFFMVNWHLLGG